MTGSAGTVMDVASPFFTCSRGRESEGGVQKSLVLNIGWRMSLSSLYLRTCLTRKFLVKHPTGMHSEQASLTRNRESKA